MDFVKELNKYGLTPSQYEALLNQIDLKLNGELDVDWTELVDKYSLTCHPDTIRKGSTSIFGGKFRTDYLKNQIYTNSDQFDKEKELNAKLDAIRKERIKLQTANVERNRLDRQEARQEMFYEYIGSVCETLPLPEFKPLYKVNSSKEYLLTIADVHYGSAFSIDTNEYNPEIAKQRFEKLAGDVIEFVNSHEISKLNILGLGDNIQNVLRISDLKLNDSSIVKATVEVSRLIASFLNEISAVCQVEYYHTPFANHTQIRPLGTKASELADEDLEYVIGHYIQDLCVMNDRVKVVLSENDSPFINFAINGNEIISCHGHNLKGYKNALRDITVTTGHFYDYLIVGHYHGGDMFTSHEGFENDCEVIVAPSFVGTCPYAKSLMKGSKAACLMLGFDRCYGHVETYKFILN